MHDLKIDINVVMKVAALASELVRMKADVVTRNHKMGTR